MSTIQTGQDLKFWGPLDNKNVEAPVSKNKFRL
jgi:hypothetical protein